MFFLINLKLSVKKTYMHIDNIEITDKNYKQIFKFCQIFLNHRYDIGNFKNN